jgi:hypothetical protein
VPCEPLHISISAAPGCIGWPIRHTVISLDVSKLVKNSQFFQSSTVPSDVRLTLRHTRTLPSIPPVAAISPSLLKLAATTESV